MDAINPDHQDAVFGYERHPLSCRITPGHSYDPTTQFETHQLTDCLVSITIFEGKVLTGWPVLTAFAKLGVKPHKELFQELPEGEDPIECIAKVERIFLTDGQRAMCAAKMVQTTWGGDRKSDQARNSDLEKVTDQKAAELWDVSVDSVRVARKILRLAPQLADEVWEGGMSLNKAEVLISGKGKSGREEIRLKRTRTLVNAAMRTPKASDRFPPMYWFDRALQAIRRSGNLDADQTKDIVLSAYRELVGKQMMIEDAVDDLREELGLTEEDEARVRAEIVKECEQRCGKNWHDSNDDDEVSSNDLACVN